MLNARRGTPSGAENMTLAGRVALVTGSGRNIGRATVLEMARRGADVVVNARTNREEAESVAEEARAMGVRAIAVLADVGDVGDDIVATFEQILEDAGGVQPAAVCQYDLLLRQFSMGIEKRVRHNGEGSAAIALRSERTLARLLHL